MRSVAFCIKCIKNQFDALILGTEVRIPEVNSLKTFAPLKSVRQTKNLEGIILPY